MATITPKTPAQLADSFGALLAEKAKLAKREKLLKQAMLATGQDRLQGQMYDVCISVATGRTGFDANKAKTLLGEDVAALCVKPLADATRFNCSARVADAA